MTATAAWILVVEDDDDNRELVLEILDQNIGHPVLTKPIDMQKLLRVVAQHCEA